MSVSLEKALDIIFKNVKPCSTEILPLNLALGRIIYRDVIASINLPPYDNSAMDGYAVKCADAGKIVDVVATILAGDNSDTILEHGTVIKIMTGACIPTATEAIVPFEDVEVLDGSVRLPIHIKMNNHIRRSGEDVKQGSVIIESGTTLSAYQTALLASQGISYIEVYKKPSVAVFATGEELKMPYESIQAHQLFNSNSQTILARATELGAHSLFTGSAKDNLNDIKAHVKNSLGHDLIVTSGGVSVGDADFTKESFASFGFETLFEKIDIKPGKPTIFGKIGSSYILNLPGNPLAASLIFEIFAEAIISKLSGKSAIYRKPIITKLKNELKMKAGRDTIIAGFYDGESFEPSLKRSPGMVSPLAYANAFMVISSNVEILYSGSEIKIMPLVFEFSSNTRESLLT